MRCDVCRRYARFRMIDGLADVEHRIKRFSCSRCDAEAYLCLIEPVKETGMQDYRLDEIERPSDIPLLSIGSSAAAVDRVSTIPATSCRPQG